MPKVLAVMFGDSHLQESAWASSKIQGDSMYSLEQIFSYAIRNKAKAVVGAGDLIDKQRNRAGPINYFHTQIDRLEEAGVPFWFIEGQHDMDDPPWLSGHRWAKHMHKEEVQLGNFKLYGLNYLAFGELQEALDNVPDDTDMLVCHQTWGDWMGDIASPQGDFSQVPVVKLLFSGDFHKFVLEKAKGKDGQKIIVCSPGSTCMQEINEPPEKYFIAFMDDGTFQRVKLKTRRMIDWPVMNRPEELNAFPEQIEGELASAAQKAAGLELPDNLTTPLLRVTYSNRLEDAVRRVEKVVAGRAHLFFKELPPEEKLAKMSIAKKEKGEAVTPLTELPKEVDQEKEPDVFSVVQRLLTTAQAGGNPKDELLKWRSEYLEDAAAK